MSNDTDGGKTIVRYSAAERTNHWIVAICFLLLALSGLALFHPAMFWLSNLFGGGTWTRILHPFIGIVMFVAFILLIMRVWCDNRMNDRDWQWLKQWRDVVNNREENVPEVGRYNGGQKLPFVVLVVACSVCFCRALRSGAPTSRRIFRSASRVWRPPCMRSAHSRSSARSSSTYTPAYGSRAPSGDDARHRDAGLGVEHHRAWFRDVIRRGE
jgi:formate dehydrogenase subunit gamma